MSDPIDRQAAIDALDEQIRQCDKALSAFDISMKDAYAVKVERASLVAFRETLEYMPSAQPERKVFREMSDTEFEKWLHKHGICNPDIHESIPCDAIPSLIDFAINELPPTQPERKGRWIKLDMHAHLADHKCTACGQECYVPTCMGEPMYTYCPNCGADMRGEEDSYSNDDMTFCSYEGCVMKKCDRHASHIHDKTRPHSYADFKECAWWNKGGTK